MPAKKTAKKSPTKSSAPAAADGSRGSSLLSIAKGDVPLSEAQLNFNKLTAQLEKARARLDSREQELDGLLAHYAREVAPLEGELNKVRFQIVTAAVAGLEATPLPQEDKGFVLDVIYNKGTEVMQTGAGLTEEQVVQVRKILDDLEPTTEQEAESGNETEAAQAAEEGAAIAEHLKMMFAMKFGVELDLSGIDFSQEPHMFQAEIRKRMDEAMARAADGSPPQGHRPPQPRKRTKAQEAKARRQEEAENAKLTDLKTLYKQLAKVLHPDLESDPDRKLQKQEWMQRLTKAHAAGDLHELLSIEMQWLGVEASNLATATDKKLTVYASVLKEQIAEVKMHIHNLPMKPRFEVLHRFLPPFGYGICQSAVQEFAMHLHDDIWQSTKELQKLMQGGPARLKLFKQWAKAIKKSERDSDGFFW